MKFPKDRATFAMQIRQYDAQNDYQSISDQREAIINSFPENVKDGVWLPLIKSGVFLHKYQETLDAASIIKQYLTYEMLFYILICALAKNDLYLALSYINNSELLNSSLAKSYREEGGANYTLVANAPRYMRKALVLCTFIDELKDEVRGNLDPSYLIIRIYEMLDVLYQIGYDDDFIREMEFVILKVFMA